MAKPNILVVDSDEGFGNMLKEGLENSGHYQAECVHTGSDALEAIVEEQYDLVIVDTALTDMPPTTLVQAIREAKSGMRIMVILLMGQALPRQMEALNINGVLTKPFFVGDLPDLIDQTLGRRRITTTTTQSVLVSTSTQSGYFASGTGSPAGSAAPVSPTAELGSKEALISTADELQMPVTTAVPQETVSFLRANESEILRLLDDLNREVRAEAILVIAGQELIAHAGMLGRDQCQELTMLVAQSTQAAAQAARFLSEQAGRFVQSLHEGEQYRLYTLTLDEGILLSLALSSNVPLGMIRHQCRLIGEQLTRFII